MGTFTLTHDIRCSAQKFWDLFFDREYNDKLYLGALGFPEFKLLEQRETETGFVRKAAGQPNMDMPAPIAKLLGSGFRYVEEGTYDKAKGVYRWKMTPSSLADKMRNEGVLRVEPISDDRCKRIVELTIEAKIFGVGGLLEKTAEKSMRDGWEKSAVFLNDWVTNKK